MRVAKEMSHFLRIEMAMMMMMTMMVVTVVSSFHMPVIQGRFRSSLLMSMDSTAATTICPLLPSPAYPAETAEFAMG